MTARIVRHDADQVKAEPVIEIGRLEIVGLQQDLAATPCPSLLLDGLHQPLSMPLPSHLGRDEEVAQVARAAPGPAISTADHTAVGAAQKQPEQLAVGDAGRRDVELV